MPEIRFSLGSSSFIPLLFAAGGAFLGCSEPEIAICELECGVGMVCLVEGGENVCRPADPEALFIDVTHPEPERFHRDAPIDVDCEVRAPQLQQVLLIATPPPLGEPVSITARDIGGGRWTAKYTEAMGAVVEGTHSFHCEAYFGPPVHGNLVRSDVIFVHVDRTPPVIDVVAPEGWIRPDDEVVILARLHDRGTDEELPNAGLDLTSVVLVVDGEHEIRPSFSISAPGTDDVDEGGEVTKAEFVIDVASLVPETFAGSIPWVVRASDLVGNTAVVSRILHVASEAPVISFDRELAGLWRARNSPAFTVPLTIHHGDDGAPLAGPPQVFLSDGTLHSTAEERDEGWVLSFSPAELGREGEEVELEWTVKAVNVAGFEASASGILRVDDLAPQVFVPQSLPWVRRGDAVVVDVMAVDAGSGVDPAFWAHGPEKEPIECEALGEEEYRCLVPTDAATEGVEAAFLTPLHFRDLTGNAGTVDLVVPVDGAGPLLSWAWEEAPWLPAADEVEVEVLVVDEAAGVERVFVSNSGSDGEVDCVPRDGAAWRCVVDTSTVIGAVDEHPVSIHALDSVGNVTVWADHIRVDAAPPSVSFDDPSPWFGADDSVVLHFHVEDEGSGVAAVSVLIDDESFACLDSNGPDGPKTHEWSCLVMEEAKGGVSTVSYVVRAIDAMGLMTEKEGTLRVDAEPPRISLQTASWLPRNESVVVTIDVEEEGSGLVPDSVHVPHPSGPRPCTPGTGFSYSCPIDTTAAPAGSTTHVQIEIRAADRAGNTAVELVDVLVDDEGPQVVVDSTPSWFGYGVHDVLVTVTDSGAGLESLTTSTRLVPAGPEATNSDPILPESAGSSLRFRIRGAQFLPRERTLVGFPMDFIAVDRLGNETVRRVHFSFDDQPPSIDLQAFSYPPGSGNRLKRNAGEIEITATLNDMGFNVGGQPLLGSGVDEGGALLKFVHHNRTARTVHGTRVSGNQFRWRVNVGDPLLDAIEGEATLNFEVADAVGNISHDSMSLRLTRKLWEAEVEPGSITSWGAALALQRLWVMAYRENDSFLVSLDATTGEEIWRTPIDVGPRAHVAAGNYHVYILDKAGPDSSRLRRFIANGHSPVVDWSIEVPGFPLDRIAIANWEWASDLPPAETVIVSTAWGIRAVRPPVGGVPLTLKLISMRMAPAIIVDEERLWVSGEGEVRAIDYNPRTESTTETSIWPVGSTAYLAHGGDKVWAQVGGRLVAWWPDLSLAHNSVAPEMTLPFENPPVVGAGSHVWLLSDFANLRLFPPPNHAPHPSFPVKISFGALHTAATIGENGTAYALANGELLAVDPDGSVRWAMDLDLGANNHGESPLLGCDGTLYFGTDDGRMIALSTDSAGLSTVWPRIFRDNRNSSSTAWSIRQGDHCVD